MALKMWIVSFSSHRWAGFSLLSVIRAGKLKDRTADLELYTEEEPLENFQHTLKLNPFREELYYYLRNGSPSERGFPHTKLQVGSLLSGTHL